MRELIPTATDIDPPELVAPGPDRPGWWQVEVDAPPQTLEEVLHKLHFETNNIRHEDGRIYGGVDKDGNYVAYFVSPYAKRFWDNVEPGVVPLVKALQHKRYLTYSSCQGHCLLSRRFVGIAFNDVESREALCQPLEAANIPHLKIRRLDKAANQSARVDDAGLVKVSKGENTNEDAAGEELGFNFAFGRNYDDYCFAELIVCDQLPHDRWYKSLLRNPVKYGPLLYSKARHWDDLTKRVAALIRSSDIPKYRY